MRIALCDESATDRLTLETLVARYFRKTAVKHECVPYENITSLYGDIAQGTFYDLIITDIFYGGLPIGFWFVKELRNTGCKSAILFHTISKDFLLEGYDVAAVGYLIKPLQFDKLEPVLNRLMEHVLSICYVIQQRSRQIYIPINEIMYLESANTKCHIHRVSGETYTIYKQLSEVERELKDKRFLRCHQSFIVNMHYIAEAGDVFVLKDGTEVLIRQKEKRKMHGLLRKYLGEKDVVAGNSDYEY